MFTVLISFGVTFVLLIVLLKTRLVDFALDAPNARSLHVNLTPRTGGLAIMVGLMVALRSAQINLPWVWLVLILVSISLIDDMRGLRARWRFLVQCIVCGFFVFLYSHHMHYLLWLPVLLGLVWMTNLYNFMDGSDGLAGGMGLFGFSTYAIASYFSGDTQLATISASIAASCVAFLLFNFHPAKIFMGDSGSIPLGFLAGAIGVYGYIQGYWQGWFPLLILSPFIVDATATLFKRFMRGEKLSQAHRSHYYQRLVQLGFGHKKTAIMEYTLMLFCSVSALILFKLSNIVIACTLILWALIYLVLAINIDKAWKRKLLAQQFLSNELVS